MKRFAQFSIPLFLVFFLFFSCNFSLFGQNQNKIEERGIKIKTSECNFYEDIEICFDTDVTAIEAPKEDMIYTITEQSAVFEGGIKYLCDIVKNQIHFSETIKEGRVFIQFVVDTTGKMTDMKVVKGLSEENDKEALRIMNWISENYDWIPAKQRDKNVKVRMNIPIVFKAENTIPTKLEMPIIDESEVVIGCKLPIHNDTIQIKEDENQNKIYTIVENPPIFEGGMDNFYKIVSKNLKVTKDTQTGTRIFINFVIDTTGKMTDIKIIRSNFSEKNNAEILKTLDFINENYTWKPATIKGKKVFVRMSLPIF